MEQRLLGAKNIIVGAVVHAAKAFLYRSFGCVSPVGEKGKVANRFFRFIMTFAPPRKSPQLFPFSCRCVRLLYTRNPVVQNSIFKNVFVQKRKTTGSFNIQNLTTLDFLAYTDKTELRIFTLNDDCNNVCRIPPTAMNSTLRNNTGRSPTLSSWLEVLDRRRNTGRPYITGTHTKCSALKARSGFRWTATNLWYLLRASFFPRECSHCYININPAVARSRYTHNALSTCHSMTFSLYRCQF